ncbi:hypothetical protein SLA2020_024130 [Shorea laevis]
MCCCLCCECFQCGNGNNKPHSGTGPSTTDILLAIFLPPLAIYKRKGATAQFWISILLTVGGYAPGSIHGVCALY